MDPYLKEPILIDINDLRTWIVHEDDDLLVINKPGWVVCHPSKNGPRSSLVGAVKEYLGVDKIHLVSRLDRETSGVVILAKHRKMASILQSAIENRQVRKVYKALLCNELSGEVKVDAPLARDMESPVFVKQAVREDRTSKPAQTTFRPLEHKPGYTLAEIELHTGRKHQIRAHALYIGHPVVGDKIYGPDDTLYLEFIEHGWTERLEENLPMKRQALHAFEITFETEECKQTFTAPLLKDMLDFWESRWFFEQV